MKKKLFLVGTGCGAGTLTREAEAAINGAEVVIGAERVLRELFLANAPKPSPRLISAKPSEIPGILGSLSEERSVAVVFSGDSGFYSGAKSVLLAVEAFADAAAFEVRVLPGISSLQMLAARLGVPWQDWKLVSAHGRKANAVREVMDGRGTFFLTGGANSPAAICGELAEAGLGELLAAVGENLGASCRPFCGTAEAREEKDATFGGTLEATMRPSSGTAEAREEKDTGFFENFRAGERIVRGTAVELSKMDFQDPAVLWVAPLANANRRFFGGIPDTEFVRGKVPMTKAEVRSVILSKLAPAREDVVWDVGAGTGSVSVELGLFAGRVFAFERKAEALELIEENRRKLGAWNVVPVAGEAPGVFYGCRACEGEKRQLSYPAPDKVFVGGSGGHLPEIVKTVREANPKATICVSAICLETLEVARKVLAGDGFSIEVVQISILRTENVAGLSMLKAQNPVFLVTAGPEEYMGGK